MSNSTWGNKEEEEIIGNGINLGAPVSCILEGLIGLIYLCQENTTELDKMLSMRAKMVQRMGQLPCKKRLRRLRLFQFQGELAEVGCGDYG